jgi:hypothetical protein
MTVAKGFVVPAGGGKHFASPTPGRSFAMKLLGRETGESIMMFEETLPGGTASLYHLHRDSDEVALGARRAIHLVTPDVSFIRNLEQREFFLSGLRLAAAEAP